LIKCDNTASSGDPATGTATFRVGGGEQVTCIFANAHESVDDLPATLIVEKQTEPDGDPALFTFRGDTSGSIGDDHRLIVAGLEPGTYTSQEVVPQGWRLDGIQCADAVGGDDSDSSGHLGTATAIFLLEAGEVTTCTFANARWYHAYAPLVLK
jgi:hypothetical protein